MAPPARPGGAGRRAPPTAWRWRWRRAGRSRRRHVDVSALAWSLLDDDPDAVVGAVLDAVAVGAAPEQLGRALAFAAALRIVRFHTQNDFGDWNSVHHAFTAANALHQSLMRCPQPELLRGAIHGALRVYLDRFLNVPAARLPSATAGVAGRPGGVLGHPGRGGPGRVDRLRVRARRRVARPS